jgi:hypothetical protein
MASRADKDRGDYTTNYGYFRPDQQNVGNMVTGKYGGYLQKGGTPVDLNPFAGEPIPFYQENVTYPQSQESTTVKKPTPEGIVLSNEEVLKAAKSGVIPPGTTDIDLQRIQKIAPSLSWFGNNASQSDWFVDKYKKPDKFTTLDSENKKIVYGALSQKDRQVLKDKGIKPPYDSYLDMITYGNVVRRGFLEASEETQNAAHLKKLPFLRDKNVDMGESYGELLKTTWKYPNKLLTGEMDSPVNTAESMGPISNAKWMALQGLDIGLYPELAAAATTAGYDVLEKGIPKAYRLGEKAAVWTAEQLAKGYRKYGPKIYAIMERFGPTVLEKATAWSGKAAQIMSHRDDKKPVSPVPSMYHSYDDTNFQFRPFRDLSQATPHTILPMPGSPDQLQAAEDSTRRVVIKSMPQDTTKKPTPVSKKRNWVY